MDREESDYERSPERQTAESARRPDPGRNHGIPQRNCPILVEWDAFTGLRRGELIGLRWQDVESTIHLETAERSALAATEK
jgi:integrase